MGSKLFCTGFLLILMVESFGQRPLQKELNLLDSLEVMTYIDNTSLLEQLEFVERNKPLFIDKKGYSLLILHSISKKSNTSIFIPVINGNIQNRRIAIELDLQEQIIGIKRKLSNNQCVYK